MFVQSTKGCTYSTRPKTLEEGHSGVAKIRLDIAKTLRQVSQVSTFWHTTDCLVSKSLCIAPTIPCYYSTLYKVVNYNHGHSTTLCRLRHRLTCSVVRYICDNLYHYQMIQICINEPNPLIVRCPDSSSNVILLNAISPNVDSPNVKSPTHCHFTAGM